MHDLAYYLAQQEDKAVTSTLSPPSSASPAAEFSVHCAESKARDAYDLPSASTCAARPVKTLPRAVYDGDKWALLHECKKLSFDDVAEAFDPGTVQACLDLIARGIDVNTRGRFENTALHVAATKGCAEVVSELLRAGASHDAENEWGKTAVVLAESWLPPHRHETVDILIEAMGPRGRGREEGEGGDDGAGKGGTSAGAAPTTTSTLSAAAQAVRRGDALTPFGTFWEDALLPNQPFVLTGGCAHWLARAEWGTPAGGVDFEGLRRSLHVRSLDRIRVPTVPREATYDDERTDVALGDFVASWSGGAVDRYMKDWHLDRDAHQMPAAQQQQQQQKQQQARREAVLREAGQRVGRQAEQQAEQYKEQPEEQAGIQQAGQVVSPQQQAAGQQHEEHHTVVQQQSLEDQEGAFSTMAGSTHPASSSPPASYHKRLYDCPHILAWDWLNEWSDFKSRQSAAAVEAAAVDAAAAATATPSTMMSPTATATMPPPSPPVAPPSPPPLADDFRFCYMGPRGTMTPLHHDVLASYSWSANIAGTKRWYFFPEGEERKLTDARGELLADVRHAVAEADRFPEAGAARCVVVDQHAGDVVFVPSLWHHQVHNMTDTISINHNWVNACCLGRVWSMLRTDLEATRACIVHERWDQPEGAMAQDEWEDQVELIMCVNSRMGMREWYAFLQHFAFLELRECVDLAASRSSGEGRGAANLQTSGGRRGKSGGGVEGKVLGSRVEKCSSVGHAERDMNNASTSTSTATSAATSTATSCRASSGGSGAAATETNNGSALLAMRRRMGELTLRQIAAVLGEVRDDPFVCRVRRERKRPLLVLEEGVVGEKQKRGGVTWETDGGALVRLQRRLANVDVLAASGGWAVGAGGDAGGVAVAAGTDAVDAVDTVDAVDAAGVGAAGAAGTAGTAGGGPQSTGKSAVVPDVSPTDLLWVANVLGALGAEEGV
jgi:hypothetical protein